MATRGWEYVHDDADWQFAEVECPAALKAIKHLVRLTPRGVERGPVFDLPQHCPVFIHRYQMWLRKKLEQSGLAQGLAGGPGHLPDIYDYLPKPWRYLAAKFRPRDVRGTIRHILKNLEWYVDQTRQVRTPVYILSEMFMPVTYITLIIYATIALSTALYRQHVVVHIGVIAAIAAVIALVLNYLGKNSLKHHTNCAELHRYLRNSYAEYLELDDGERVRQIAGHMKELKERDPFKLNGSSVFFNGGMK